MVEYAETEWNRDRINVDLERSPQLLHQLIRIRLETNQILHIILNKALTEIPITAIHHSPHIRPNLQNRHKLNLGQHIKDCPHIPVQPFLE